MDFKTAWILPSYSGSCKFFNNNPTIVAASDFDILNKEPEHYHEKVIIGRLLTVTSPERGLFAGRTIATSTRNAMPTKGKRTVTTIQPYSLLLIFADYFDSPNCFGIFLSKKWAFQSLWGVDISNSSKVKVGDMFAIKDPQPGLDQLGESIYIIKNPTHIAGIIPYGWPTTTMISSSEANQQVFFDETNKIIKVLGTYLHIGGGEDYPNCMGYTCDRVFKCKGCFGRSPTRKPMVLSCSVYVADCPEYNDAIKRADFHHFTSLTFTSLFFQNIVTLSRLHKEIIGNLHSDIQQAVLNIVNLINTNGGWRVVGWHRRGVTTDDESGEAILSETTAGHLTMLMPTNSNILLSDEFKSFQIPTPAHDTVPPILPGVNIQNQERNANPRENGTNEATFASPVTNIPLAASLTPDIDSQRRPKRHRSPAGPKVTGLNEA
jgi:hypothetical protein